MNNDIALQSSSDRICSLCPLILLDYFVGTLTMMRVIYLSAWSNAVCERDCETNILEARRIVCVVTPVRRCARNDRPAI